MKVYIVYNWAVESIDAVFLKRKRAEEFMLEGINQMTCRIEEHDVIDGSYIPSKVKSKDIPSREDA